MGSITFSLYATHTIIPRDSRKTSSLLIQGFYVVQLDLLRTNKYGAFIQGLL
jgi:hypothetical protein